MRLRGQVCLVTGASSGIGRALAQRFAHEGADLILTARRRHLLEEVAREIQHSRPEGRLLVLPADLRRPEDIDSLARESLAAFGRVDIVINNAGIGYFAPATELALEPVEELWQVNVRAPMLLTRALLPSMIERRSGTLLYVASLAGKYGVKEGSVYAATKFALRGFAWSVFQEVRQHNIRVIVLCPGSTATPFGGGVGSGSRSERILQPEDVADIALAAVLLPPTATVSELELRPTNP
ncbi:putative oxidoreductase [bacterium HR21]|jgi:3-oxoacyl-[acyl-carrier protein] reductase|nr:putative oxidoreductase [bacterium HR21]